MNGEHLEYCIQSFDSFQGRWICEFSSANLSRVRKEMSIRKKVIPEEYLRMAIRTVTDWCEMTEGGN